MVVQTQDHESLADFAHLVVLTLGPTFPCKPSICMLLGEPTSEGCLRKRVFLKSSVRENRTPGSVRGLSSSWQSYRDMSREGPYQEETMPFKALFIAHAPDADKKKHRSEIDTGQYHLLAVVVRDQNQAVQTAKESVEQEGVESILLCPGFTHSDVAEIADAVGPRVAVAVARGDGPSSRASAEARARAFGTDR